MQRQSLLIPIMLILFLAFALADCNALAPPPPTISTLAEVRAILLMIAF